MFLGHFLYFGDHLIINSTYMMFDILDVPLLHTICLFNTCNMNRIASSSCILSVFELQIGVCNSYCGRV